VATETIGRGEARVGLQHAATLFDHGCRDMRGDGGALGVRIVSARGGSGFCGGPKLHARERARAGRRVPCIFGCCTSTERVLRYSRLGRRACLYNCTSRSSRLSLTYLVADLLQVVLRTRGLASQLIEDAWRRPGVGVGVGGRSKAGGRGVRAGARGRCLPPSCRPPWCSWRPSCPGCRCP
jgi:hypothetical protein